MNESKVELMDRLRREGRWSEASKFKDAALADFRAKGMTRDEAGAAAWEAMEKAYPPRSAEDVVVDAGRVRGLQEIPSDWPDLPSNASLQAELRWCQSNRIRVAEEMRGGAIRVHLERAGSPAPSHAALGWLETAIRFPAKFVDICARSLKDQVDEADRVRRERMSIAEVESLLAEMVDDNGD